MVVKKVKKRRIPSKPALLRGPYLQVATPTSITIRWRTDASARSQVRYGTAASNLDRTAVDSTLTTEHIVKLTGLTPRTKY